MDQVYWISSTLIGSTETGYGLIYPVSPNMVKERSKTKEAEIVSPRETRQEKIGREKSLIQRIKIKEKFPQRHEPQIKLFPSSWFLRTTRNCVEIEI